jgi:hypothetical protein
MERHGVVLQSIGQYFFGRPMRLLVLAGAAGLLLLSGGVHADPVVYSWTGYGGFGPKTAGSTRCGSFKMTVNVSVDGDSVKGVFQQQGRDERNFETTLGKDGTFKTTAVVGGGGIMDVTGVIKDGESTVLLDGYCRFDARLTRK